LGAAPTTRSAGGSGAVCGAVESSLACAAKCPVDAGYLGEISAIAKYCRAAPTATATFDHGARWQCVRWCKRERKRGAIELSPSRPPIRAFAETGDACGSCNGDTALE